MGLFIISIDEYKYSLNCNCFFFFFFNGSLSDILLYYINIKSLSIFVFGLLIGIAWLGI